MTQVVNTKNITSSTTAAEFLAPNAAREEFWITNNSTAILYVLYGPGIASSTNFTFEIVGNATDVLLTPVNDFGQKNGFRGRVSGVWASANGTAQVGEILRDDSSEAPPPGAY